MAEIYLIGTIHEDGEGSEKLERLLGELKPQIVLAEGATSVIQLRERFLGFLEDELVARRADTKLKAAILKYERNQHFEGLVSKRYATAHQIEFDFFNDRKFDASRQKARFVARDNAKYLLEQGIKGFREFYLQQNLAVQKRWDSLKAVVDTEEEREEAERIVNNREAAENDFFRDAIMESVLRNRVAANGAKRIVTVTGAAHILDDPKDRNFYGKIRDLQPKRKFLY